MPDGRRTRRPPGASHSGLESYTPLYMIDLLKLTQELALIKMALRKLEEKLESLEEISQSTNETTRELVGKQIDHYTEAKLDLTQRAENLIDIRDSQTLID